MRFPAWGSNMPKFNKNVITQVSGFDNALLSGELVWNQKTYWNLQIKNCGTVIDLTGATIAASIVRRTVTNLIDTRNGLSFDVGDYTPTPTPVNLTITNFVAANGSFTLVIDDSTWSLINSDPELSINANDPVAFTGRIKISIPVQGTNPAQDWVIFLFFLVRSDGVIKV
jgi:hypothetical protein